MNTTEPTPVTSIGSPKKEKTNSWYFSTDNILFTCLFGLFVFFSTFYLVVTYCPRWCRKSDWQETDDSNSTTQNDNKPDYLCKKTAFCFSITVAIILTISLLLIKRSLCRK